ncbi:uncharacterized protein MYCGRDRAFT_106665, partial [Zymoseptoria tritici IPO323]
MSVSQSATMSKENLIVFVFIPLFFSSFSLHRLFILAIPPIPLRPPPSPPPPPPPPSTTNMTSTLRQRLLTKNIQARQTRRQNIQRELVEATREL